MLLDPALVRSAPELACLEILTGVLEATLIAIVATHPCIESQTPCACPLAPCCCADTIHNRIHELDNAILGYRAVVEAALEADRNGEMPF